VQETVTINVSDILAGPGMYPYTQSEVEPFSILDSQPSISKRFI